MRMEPKGPAGTGLELWPAMSAAELESGSPVQHGHMYLDDKATGLCSGVWTCTAFTGKMGPYSVSEFMLLLEGSVTIREASGRETTINAGESFVIPKGLVCQWVQTGFVRKFFVIFEDASGARAKDPAALKVLKTDTKVKLGRSEGPDAALVVGGVPPVWHDHQLFADPTGQLMVGVWETTPYERKPIDFPRHELMHILSGEVALTGGEPDSAQVFKAGDTLLVSMGSRMAWKNATPVRKIYCIFLPKKVAAVRSAAE